MTMPAARGASGFAYAHAPVRRVDPCKCQTIPAGKQRRRTSLLESLVNVAAGLAFAIAGQLVIFSLLGISVTSSQTGEIAAFMTALSIPRQYLVRRFFEWLRFTGIMR